MKLSGVSEKVFLDRYSLKDAKGASVEKTPEEMWVRVAKAVAEVEGDKKRSKKWEKKFYSALEDFKYIPGGRILAGAGTGYDVTYYNCFVIPSPQDSRGGIIDTLKQMIEIMAHGGGVGINLSSLRPRGARVKKVNGFSSGPCNWAELFSIATKDIIQQGGSRRGALMLMMWDWHPDIEEFITVKQDLTRINGANLSVCFSDSFMEAVKKDQDWPLVFPDVTDPEYDTVWDGDLEEWKKKGKKVIVQKIVRARDIWDLVAEAAWKSAEPGVVFMERYNKEHNNWYWNRINCVNPCGEEGLPKWGVCNLGSINLSAFVSKTKDVDTAGEFDYEGLKEVVRTAVRFQDNVVDMDPYIFEGIRETQLNGERRIGLGTMGLGDCLIKMHLRYGSPEALRVVDSIYKLIRDESYRASVEVAKEKGAFPKFDKKLFPKGLFIQRLPEDVQAAIKEFGIRNSVILMQAPTGSTSLMANTTSGIEPVFEFEFTRRDRLGTHTIRHYLYDEWYDKHKDDIESGKVIRPEWFVSANDLSPEDHVTVQGTIQKYVDASISKTVNAPETHTIEDVKRLYTLAYDLGCKGIAYMREGSRQGVLERKEAPKKEDVISAAKPIQPRPLMMSGATYKINTPVGNAYITINVDEVGQPKEVFMNVGKAGSDVNAMAEGLGRMISVMLRAGQNLEPRDRVRMITDELQNIGGGRVAGFGKNAVRSLPDAVAKVLSLHFGESEHQQIEGGPNGHVNGNGSAEATVAIQADGVGQAAPLFAQETAKKKTHFDICSECGQATLVYEEGCKKCYGCGMSAC